MEGIERLRVMAMNGGSMQKQYFKIFMYLKKRTDMDEKFQNPEKSFEQMYEYIKSEVKKQAVLSVLKELELLDDPLNNPISKAEICRRAGVSKTFLYTYKYELL